MAAEAQNFASPTPTLSEIEEADDPQAQVEALTKERDGLRDQLLRPRGAGKVLGGIPLPIRKFDSQALNQGQEP